MSSPTSGYWCRPKRLARFLQGKPRVVHKYKWHESTDKLSVYSDAGWAGDKISRKSITGGCILPGQHLLKGWSRTQTHVALSAGESEFYAVLKAASVGLGMIAIARDVGIYTDGEVWGDASAALGIIKRRGLCDMRHMDTGRLWMQEVAVTKTPKVWQGIGPRQSCRPLQQTLLTETSSSIIVDDCPRCSRTDAHSRRLSGTCSRLSVMPLIIARMNASGIYLTALKRSLRPDLLLTK